MIRSLSGWCWGVLLAPVVAAQPAPMAPAGQPGNVAPQPATPPTGAPSGAVPGQPPQATPRMSQPVEWPKEIEGKDLKGWLSELRESTDAAIRFQAVKVLPRFGPAARKDALEALVSALGRESDPSVRVNIIIVLGNIGPETPLEGKKLVDPLKNLLANSATGGPSRLYSALALMNMPQYAQDTLPQFKLAAEDTSFETRREVARAIGVIFRPVSETKGPSLAALDLLTARLKVEKSAVVRMELVQSLLMLGPPVVKDPAEYGKLVGPYFKSITEHMKSEKDKAIQVWMYMVLMRYDGSQLNDATIKKIADHIVGTDIHARVAALRALALLEDRAKPFVASIMDAARIDDPISKLEALNALAALRAHAKDAIPELEKLKAAAKDEDLKLLYTQTIDAILGKKAIPPAPPKN